MNKLLGMLTLTGMCLVLSSCTSTLATAPTTTPFTQEISTSLWKTPLPDELQSVTIEYTLPKEATAELYLLQSYKKDEEIAEWYSLFRLHLNNIECTYGHSVTAHFQTPPSKRQFHYFSRESLWHTPNRIRLTKVGPDRVKIEVNDEAMEPITLTGQPRHLVIITKKAPITLHQITYNN